MKLAILGASGHGKVVADTAQAAGWETIVFFDDAWPKVKMNGAWSVVGNTHSLVSRLDVYQGVVVAIGNNHTRLLKCRELKALRACLVSLVHPNATVSPSASLGGGTVVFAGAVIQADAHLGEGCIVNTLSSIDHDCELADGVHISPGAHLAGAVCVGEASWIGIGSSVKQSVRIGSNVTVGAGAAVISDIPDAQRVVGVPAQPISQ